MLKFPDRAVLVLARVLPALLFLHEGWHKIANYAAAEAYMARFSMPPLLLVPAIALEIGGGLALVTGFFTRYAALALGLFCIAAAVLFHSRLTVPSELLHFEKDLAIAGGLLALALHAPPPRPERSRAL